MCIMGFVCLAIVTYYVDVTGFSVSDSDSVNLLSRTICTMVVV